MARTPARKGPVPRHSTHDIAAAAVELADREGLAAVTVRRLSAELLTGGGALYRYFSSRDRLLDLMIDAVSAELPAPGQAMGDPISDLVRAGEELLALYRRHPWLVDVQQSVSTPGPHAVDHFERCLATLEPANVDRQRKMEAIAMMTGVVTLFAQQAAVGPTTRLVVDDQQRWPHLSAALQGATPPSDPRPDLFARVLAGVLAGLLGDG